MGLFGFGKKREPCAICGGEVKGLFPSRVEGQLVCNECYGTVDLPSGMNLNMEQFIAYRAFREENDALKRQFTVTQKIDFGFFDTKIIFDTEKKLMCMDERLSKTVFQGKEIVSFVIKEDATPLFEGSALGLRRHISTVPERANALLPRIEQIIMQTNMRNAMERMMQANAPDRDGDGRPDYRPVPPQRHIDIPEPFANFNLEIRLKHPYWKTLTADMSGPTFNHEYPDLNDYLCRYQESSMIMEQLALALMEIAFPNTSEQIVDPANSFTANRSVSTAASVSTGDTVEEIKRFKALMDQGIITEEEFTAKKRQLLGI